MQNLFNRRMFLTTSLSLFSAAALAQQQQQRHVFQIKPSGDFKPIPIAVTNFGGDPNLGSLTTQILTNNIKHSVYLTPIDSATFPEQINDAAQTPRFEAWKTINAPFVLTGSSQRSGDGRIASEFRLWDTSTNQIAAGQHYTTDATNTRRVAHIISDAVFSRITGENGFFDTHIAFIDETGPKEKRRKRLAIMDQDGANVRYLTKGDELVVTPRFSPNSQELTYMAFGDDEPKVYLLTIDSGQREIVGKFPGMTFSPRFSPDGKRIIMSLSQGSYSNIYTMDLDSDSTTRLTDSSAIDTSPCYSPDGSKIVFESDRGGSQQIYVMAAGGGVANRISFGDGHYSTPAWSPKGDLIAFTRQRAGQFGIGVMKLDGSGERILTEGFHNEGPSFSPNGLFVMFFREAGGQGGPKIFMADIFGHGEFPVPTPAYGSDPSWGPLLG